ncbi:MAG: hypothetical protein RL194_951, partial [Pseudomonadota bacterium]
IDVLVIEHRKELLHVTASLGVSQWKPDEPVDALIERTDTVLFQAKYAGRNRSLVA